MAEKALFKEVFASLVILPGSPWRNDIGKAYHT